MEDLLKEFTSGNQRALARVISQVENETPQKVALLKQLYPNTGNSYLLGVTGSPGAGKSSLVDHLVDTIRKRNESVGVIAVDPTSPFTGGAILGDRIRMNKHALDKGVFIRSMGTRGSLGGLSKTTKEVIKVMDAFGMDWIIVETVGVGQAELDIMYIADTTVVVLTPGSGDAIQTMKAGIMEIADVFAVNKCDMPGADGIAAEVELMLDLQDDHVKWRPPVIKTSTVNKGEGILDLLSAIEKHRNYLTDKGIYEQKRLDRIKSETLDIVNYQWQRLVKQKMNLPGSINQLLEKVARREIDPYTASASILESILSDFGIKNNFGGVK